MWHFFTEEMCHTRNHFVFQLDFIYKEKLTMSLNVLDKHEFLLTPSFKYDQNLLAVSSLFSVTQYYN
jgi:hypothetical protein